MKRLLTLVLTLSLCVALAVPALAADFTFTTGPDSATTFGKPSSIDAPVPPDPMSENARRNKDAAFLPPPYFYGSGDIPTDLSSLYHDHGAGGINSYGGAISLPPSGFEATTSVKVQNTVPMYYADGSIGSLHISRTGKTIKVYEGEESLSKGAGHFTMTSAWDGNVALCGHNRGSNAYFAFVKDLKIGDTITYTTLYGSRVYEVFSREQISELDYAKLGWSASNMLTLITCVENTPELRWAAQLREVK